MLSIPDMALLGAAALLLFGPEQLPRVMRKAGAVMRDVQNTSQSFIREIERAADAYEPPGSKQPWETATSDPYDPPTEPLATESVATEPEPPVAEKLAGPRPAIIADPPEPEPSRPAQAAPQADHSTHV